MATVHDGLVFPAVYVDHCGCPFIFTGPGVRFKGIRQPQCPSFFFHVFFAAIVKYNVVGMRNFQQVLAIQPLGPADQFPVQVCIIQESTERHVRVIGTLVFVKAQGISFVFAEQFPEHGVPVFFIYMNIIICFCHRIWGIPFVKILCLSTYIVAYGTGITTEIICRLPVSCMLCYCSEVNL